MKPWLPLALIFACLVGMSAPLRAASADEAKPAAAAPGVALASTFSQVTGVAISPLLGASAVGAYQYFRAPAARRAALPWYAQLKFWLPALLIVVLVACKDSFGTLIPGTLKKPLDALEALENKASGLVMAGAMVPLTMNALSKLVLGGHATTAAAHFFVPTGLAMLPLAAVDLHWLLNILMIPLGVVVFLIVWLTAHTINVLILLSPFSTLDAGLKLFRTAVLSLLTITAWINPWVGAALSLLILVIAWLLAGKAFRFMIYGSLFCWDFFTRRHRRFQLLAEGNWLFTARKLRKTPSRTYGRLYLTAEGRLLLKYRPWLVRKECEVEVPRAGLAVGRGLLHPVVLGHDAAADKVRALLLLPPRYQGHEELFARTYQISGVTDVGLRKAWAWLKEVLGFGAKKAAAAPEPATA